MYIKLLTEHHLEFLSLIGGCTGSSGSTLVKMPYCWKSHAVAYIHFQNHFLYVAQAELCSYVYTLFVLYYVIHATISCELSYGGNKDKEKKQ